MASPARQEDIGKARYANQAAVKRAVAGAIAGGLELGGVEVLPDGRIRILDKRAAREAQSEQVEKYL